MNAPRLPITDDSLLDDEARPYFLWNYNTNILDALDQRLRARAVATWPAPWLCRLPPLAGCGWGLAPLAGDFRQVLVARRISSHYGVEDFHGDLIAPAPVLGFS